jgi:hypothetical protein
MQLNKAWGGVKRTNEGGSVKYTCQFLATCRDAGDTATEAGVDTWLQANGYADNAQYGSTGCYLTSREIASHRDSLTVFEVTITYKSYTDDKRPVNSEKITRRSAMETEIVYFDQSGVIIGSNDNWAPPSAAPSS